MSGKTGSKTSRPRTSAHIKKVNVIRQAKHLEWGAVAFDLRVRCFTLEQIRAELIARGIGEHSLSAIDRAWKAYANRHPSEEVEDRRRTELQRLDERERRMRSYVDRVDDNGQPVQVPLRTAIDVETRLATISQQRILLTGMAVPVREDTGEKAGAPVTIQIVYPDGVKKGDGGSPAPAAAG